MAIFLFLIFLLMGVYFTFVKPRYLIVFVLATGPVNVGGVVIGQDLDSAAVWLLFLTLMILFALVSERGGKKIALTAFEKAYLLFLAWCVGMWIFSPEVEFGARMFLKLLYPLLIMMLAQKYVTGDEDRKRVLFWIIRVAMIAVLFTGGATHFFSKAVTALGRQVFIGWAPFADYTAMMAILFFVCWKLNNRRNFLIFFVLLACSPIVFGIRTGILTIAVGVTLVLLFTEKVYSYVPKILVAYLLAGLALFLLPESKSYMFYRPDQVNSWEIIQNPTKLNFDQIDAHGRFEMWRLALDKFFYPHPLEGSGLGSCQKYFYTDEKYKLIKVVHNEYVRLLCDVGAMGVALYAIFVFSLLYYAWKVFKRTQNRYIKGISLFVLTSVPALLVAMYFDNLLDYILYASQYPFAFLGMLAQTDASTVSMKEHPYG